MLSLLKLKLNSMGLFQDTLCNKSAERIVQLKGEIRVFEKLLVRYNIDPSELVVDKIEIKIDSIRTLMDLTWSDLYKIDQDIV